MSDEPKNRPTDPQPSQQDIVSQISESEQNETGPNEVLRRHIEMYSKYSPVFRSLGHTLVGAAFLPAILAFIAFQLGPLIELSTLRCSVARGLWFTCLPLYVSLVLARALRPGGLAEQHFGWAPKLSEGLLKTMNVMIWGWLPLRFLYTALETFDGGGEQTMPGRFNDSFGRLLFIAAMIAFAFALWSTARIFRKWIQLADDNDADFFRGLLFWFLPLMPVSLALMSAMGYHFTAVAMSWRMMWTVILMIGISMAGGLVSRLLLIAQFVIKVRQLSRNDEGEIKNNESIDISGITKQVNRLLRATALVAMVLVGWQLWGEVLPAINYLDQWEMPWSWLGADGIPVPITLRHILMSIGVVAITVILSRNLPGLLEITLLDRLPLDRGGRYAISIVVRYLVGIVGVLTACHVIGFNWHNVQWLAAGLTVGLGFGLQEIFANVVSGIIILIERPIRVGDVVTVNNTTGTVTQMKLRATTILDLEFRELIVPNKKFITEDVMNWTLSTLTSRISLSVGVAYGSDTELVEKTLMQVARRHPLINEEPEPSVVFKAFGDSTLNFELRVFIPNRDVYAKVHHELNMGIDAAFRAKNIEIAFPQRDLHIKNLHEFPLPSPGTTNSPSGSTQPGGTPLASTGGSGDGAGVSALAESPPEFNESPKQDNDDRSGVDDDDTQYIIPFPYRQAHLNRNDGANPRGRRDAS